MFSVKHIILLAVCAAIITCSLILLKKYRVSLKCVLRVLLGIGIVSETIKMFTYILANENKLGGYLPKTDLPFHLCSIQLILIVLLHIVGNGKFKRTLYAFMFPTCLVGGICALLIPTSSSLSMPLITVQYFIYHSAIIIYGIYLVICGEIKFEFKDYLATLAMLYAFFIIAIYLNSWINDYQNNINFMYVVNPPADGLPYLNKDHGWLVYIAHYAILAFSIVTLCYIKPIINRFRHPEKEGNKIED